MALELAASRQSKAIVTRAVDNQWRMEEVTLRAVGSDELLVRVAASGICHTDLKVGKRPQHSDRILGHEGAGHVLAVGTNITVARAGDPVILSFASCRTCRSCKTGHPAYCRDIVGQNFKSVDGIFSVGETSVGGSFFGQSSFSNLTIVKESCVVNVSSLVRDESELGLFAPLACGFQTGCGTVIRLANASEEDSICVLGLGNVGLAAIMAAKIKRCSTIIGVDRVVSRLHLAQELGATHVIDTTNATETYLRDQVKEITQGQGATITVDTTGHIPLIQQCLSFTSNLGKLILVASPEGDGKWELHIPNFVATGIQIMGSIEGDAEPTKAIPQMIEWYREGKFPLEKLIRTFPVEKFEEAILLMLAGTAIKPVLLW